MDALLHLLLGLLLFSAPSTSILRRQARQLPRFPLFDAIFARLQGRPQQISSQGPPNGINAGPPPQRARPPQFEGGFTPLSSGDFQGPPLSASLADSVDLTFQSLGQGLQRRPGSEGGPFNRPQGVSLPPHLGGPPELIHTAEGPFGPQRPSQPSRRPPPATPSPFPQIANPSGGFSQQLPILRPAPDLSNDVRNEGAQRPPSVAFQQTALHTHGGLTSPVTASARRATLGEVLREDCEDFEDKGFCESPQRYPTAQVVALVNRCSRILESLYVPVPESNAIASKGSSSLERANHGVWSWAKYSAKDSVCASDARSAAPSYARDATGKWVVVLQHGEGNMVQRVPVEECVGVGRPCLSSGEHRGTKCVQRRTHHHLVTWDPDSPDECPTLRVFSFPTACLCHFSREP